MTFNMMSNRGLRNRIPRQLSKRGTLGVVLRLSHLVMQNEHLITKNTEI